MRIPYFIGGAVAAVALAGCSNGIPPNQAIQNRVALQAFQGCSELEQYIEDNAPN
jgi:hypothetical protein